MPSLDVVDATLDYDLWGDHGPLVVQLHGLTSSRTRDAVMGLDLGWALRDHRILRYDARGHGRSTGDPREASYTWPSLARDLLALLDHVAPGEQVHGVGTSMGSGTLLHAAMIEPERFASLTLVVPPTAWETRVGKASTYRDNADLVEHDGIGAFVALSSTTPEPPALADAPQTWPAVAEHLLPIVLRGAAATNLPDRRTVAGIHIPTLILAWADDPSHPLSTARQLHELIEHSRLIVARSPYGIMAWPNLFADQVATADLQSRTVARVGGDDPVAHTPQDRPR